MNFKKNALQLFGLTALYSVALAIFPKTANANQAPSLQTSDGYQIAQLTNCREVDVNTALNVRRQPGGQVVGTLNDNQNVTIAGEPANGWVRISGPMDGYVFARYLNYCAGAAAPTPSQPIAQTTPNILEGEAITTVPGSNCRQIVSPNTVIRTKPDGEVIGTLQENQLVYIANEGVNGWVPVERPVSGYVNATNLGYCS